MTQVVTVHTDFTDLDQMAQGLVGRVNDTHVILPGPDPVDVGEWVEFAVTLYDGSPGFAGVGRCVTVVDNGEERLSHQRFDVVIDSLQFDSRGQQVFDHILTLNGGGGGGYEADAAADDAVEEANFDDVSEVYTQSKIELPTEALEEAVIAARDDDGDDEDENTVIGDSMQFAGAAFDDPEQDDHQRATPRPQAPPAPPAQTKNAFSEPPTGNISVVPSAAPPPPPAPVSMPAPAMPSVRPVQTNGGAMFAYANGLPFPPVPPRPELDPTRRVSPAPRPRTAEAVSHDDREHHSV